MQFLRASTFCFALAACALAAPACSIIDPDEWAERLEALDRSRDRWADAQASVYRYTYSKSCECIPGFAGLVEIEVTDDEITSLTPLSDQVEVPEEHWPAFDTVEEMFELIASAIVRRAHQFDVEYDPVLGYPTLVSLDFDETVVDDELVIQVTELEIVAR